MKRATVVLALATLLIPVAVRAQSARIATDFEIARMEKLAASQQGFLPQLQAHLNLASARATRNEIAAARKELRIVLGIAERERQVARRHSNVSLYATATIYAGLAQAKLGNRDAAFDLLEEGTRYAADRGTNWNVVAGAFGTMEEWKKAASAARNAVAIASAAARESNPSSLLDLDVDRYTLALALTHLRREDEAESLLSEIVRSLQSSAFDEIRTKIAQSESFEIYSTTADDEAAYNSLLHRAQLKLAQVYESRGNVDGAKRMYETALAGRTDDAIALAALARLTRDATERERRLNAALDANPFSLEAIREYRTMLQSGQQPAEMAEGRSSSGASVRRALREMEAGDYRTARETLEALAASYPEADVVQYLLALNDAGLGDLDRARSRSVHLAELRKEIDATLSTRPDVPAFLTNGVSGASVTPTAAELDALVRLLAQNRLAPAQRVILDATSFSTAAVFDGTSPAPDAVRTTFESGTIGEMPFRFSRPVTFTGSFPAGEPLLFTFRILGATRMNGTAALLLDAISLRREP